METLRIIFTTALGASFLGWTITTFCKVIGVKYALSSTGRAVCDELATAWGNFSGGTLAVGIVVTVAWAAVAIWGGDW